MIKVSQFSATIQPELQLKSTGGLESSVKSESLSRFQEQGCRAQTGFSSLADKVELARRVASRLLCEIRNRWPGQTEWALKEEVAASWRRALAAAGHPLEILALRLAVALDRLSARPYPPSVGALLAMVVQISEEEVEAARRAGPMYRPAIKFNPTREELSEKWAELRLVHDWIPQLKSRT